VKITFLNPPAADVEWYGDKANFESPLALAMLAAYVRQHGHEPAIIDVAAERLSPEQVLARIAQDRPSVVGITANTVMMPPATRIAALLQEHLPEVLVVLGGKHVSVIPEDVYDGRRPVFDVSVIGARADRLEAGVPRGRRRAGEHPRDRVPA